MTLISAPAGFGKTTLVSEWIARCERPFAWLSLDDGDADLPRFLTYFITALQTVALSSAEGVEPSLGKGVLGMPQSPQLPPTDSVLTTLIHEIAAVSEEFTLVLDDYHVVDNQSIDQTFTFLLEHLPPHVHLVITTREDPNLPLACLRVRGQLTELRTADLRFTIKETAVFLNQMMDLDLSATNIAALEARTEGWIAGFEGVAPADKAFVDRFRQEYLARKRHVVFVVPARKNMKNKPPVSILKTCSRWRKLVETVGSHLTERYHIAKIRTHDLWHYQHRLIRKVLSHTICVFINLQLGRPPLHLDDLVTA
ncbi:MAG: hypothetical protein ACE5E7_02030 [Anaerolineae bacterium]